MGQSIKLSNMIPTTKKEAEKFPPGEYLVTFKSRDDSKAKLGVLSVCENLSNVGQYFLFDIHEVESYLPIEE